VAETEIAFQLPDRFLRSAATQTVMRLDVSAGAEMDVDVGDDRTEPPPVEIVTRQLITGLGRLATNDQAKRPVSEAEVTLGYL